MKITINRLFEVARIAQTDAGKQLQDFVEYIITGFEQIIRALRNGLTFSDNFNCKVSQVTLTHGQAQVINTDEKTPVGIFPIRTVSTTTTVTNLIWYIDQKGQTVVKAEFLGSPSDSQRVLLIILF